MHTIITLTCLFVLSTAGICASQNPITIPADFPQSDYTPFGYIENPYHSAVLNRSGIIRSVPPIGFGFWARKLPWPYGEGAERRLNYLSIVHLSLDIGGIRFHTSEDFVKNGVKLVSRYHSKTMMSYDWEYGGLTFSAKYFLANENALVCIFRVSNGSRAARRLTIHATNIYGFPEEKWWGSDGVAARYNGDYDAGVAKIWAYGDVFSIGADWRSAAHKATSDAGEWERWISANDLTSGNGATVRFPGHMYTIQSYRFEVPAGRDEIITLGLTRGVNETASLATLHSAVSDAAGTLNRQLAADEDFYTNAPILTGDWSPEWKHGWLYDIETLRMNIRPPVGIYKHPWDGMQIFTPRQVLGETMLDTMALSYADMRLAKDVIYGTFADTPGPNVPCTREDGSMNMICADGSEAGTAPTWGYPFHVIRSIYLRDGDKTWVQALYPHLKDFVEWWLKYRTDKDGWFHSKCSWESGQDGSKRFLVASENPAAVTDFVRTVDIEAAMANAFENMVLFADIAGRPEDRDRWRKLAEHRIETTRSMYVDGWFRDFDARNNQPIILKDYWDVMMFAPLTVGIATPQQMAGVKPKFQYFKEHPTFWLEWPSFMFPFTEAAWNAGLRDFIGEIVFNTGSRVYPRLDARNTKPIAPFKTTLPEQYAYRIPGVSNEFWPVAEDNPGGCENYGWGATLPTLVIRNVIGFREVADPSAHAFVLAPALPSSLAQSGKNYGITNLFFQRIQVDVSYRFLGGRDLEIAVTPRGASGTSLRVRDASGRELATGPVGAPLRFRGVNGAVYTIALQ